jgi:hypothetical protein
MAANLEGLHRKDPEALFDDLLSGTVRAGYASDMAKDPDQG